MPSTAQTSPQTLTLAPWCPQLAVVAVPVVVAADNGQMQTVATRGAEDPDRLSSNQATSICLLVAVVISMRDDEKKKEESKDIQLDNRLSTTSRTNRHVRIERKKKTRPRLVVQAFEDGQPTAPVELPAKCASARSLQGHHVVSPYTRCHEPTEEPTFDFIPDLFTSDHSPRMERHHQGCGRYGLLRWA